MSDRPEAGSPTSIVDVTFYALQQGGKEILKNPQRLLSYLIDMADEGPALTVLELNCDHELLEPLAGVVCGGEIPTMQGIRHAASRMEEILVHDRAVAQQPAHQAVEELCRGVIRYLAERSGAVPRPSQAPVSPGPAPEPAPTPAQPTYAHTVTVTPPAHNQTPEPSTPSPVVPPTPQPANPPVGPSTPAPNGSSLGSQEPSPLTGTMPVQVAGTPQAGSTSDPGTGSTPKPEPEKIVAPVQPTKSRTKKLAIVGAIAAAAIVIGIIASLNRVTVSFDGGSASGTTGAVKAWRNSEVTLPSSRFSRSGYSFAGWEWDGRTYQPGDAITPGDSVTLYAIWAAVVTFDGNGASSGSVDDILALPGETITLPDLSFERSGYHPIGWDDGSERFAAGDEVKVDGPVTYSVDWGPRVSFDGNGADKGSVKDVLAKPGETITLPKIEYKRSGYRANGWTSGGKLYAAGDKVIVDGPVTYSVDWGAHISFEGNGPTSGKTSDLYADSSGKVTAPKCGFTYADHVFKGWATSSNGSVRYDPGDSIDASSPETLYAIWELEPNITDKLGVEQITQMSSDDRCFILLYVKNNSSTTLEVTATIDFKSSSGTFIETKTDIAYSLAPGERTLLMQACEGAAGGEGATTYGISAAEISSSRGPIFPDVRVEELTATTGKLVARVHNYTGKKVYIVTAKCYGTGSYGSWGAAHESIVQYLEPDEYVDVTLDNTGWIAWDQFSREYYVNGYIVQ